MRTTTNVELNRQEIDALIKGLEQLQQRLAEHFYPNLEDITEGHLATIHEEKCRLAFIDILLEKLFQADHELRG